MSRSTGILADSAIMELHGKGSINAGRPFDEDQVQPASLDLRLGEVAYRVGSSFLPGEGFSVTDKLVLF